MKRKATIWLWALLLPATAGAQDLQLHGYGKASGTLGLDGDWPFSGTTRFQGDLSGSQGPAAFRLTGDLDLDSGRLDAADLSARGLEASFLPVECRLDVHGSWADFSFGKQYVFWGQTDWVNPTDLFTPWDYVNISTELEDYRVAPWAARAQLWWRQTSLDWVWVPLPWPHTMDFSMMEGEGVTVGDPVLPERTLANSDLGLRLSSRLAGLDGSLMAFRGLDKRPGMAMDADLSTMPPALTLLPTYGMMEALGGDLSRGFGPLLLKAEGAWYHTHDADGDDVTVRNQELYGVAGLTWVPHPSFNVTVQGTWSHLLAYDADAELAALEAMGDPSPEVDAADSYSLVERLAWNWRDLLSLNAVGMQGVPDGDHFEMAYASWRAADGLSVLTGVVLFGGPEDTTFGALRDQSRAFGELKYSF